MKVPKDENGPALICIPDITGFTRFMAENSIEFSRKIIPPLLRNIVNSNSLNFKVGEIEGDAVLFYRFGELPGLKELSEQCKTFYLNFTSQLKELMAEHADDFHKNNSSNRLSLKIVLHVAEITSTKIANIPKLIGEDVVVVHKLLKNSVPDNEYILMTEKLLINYLKEDIKKMFDWGNIKHGKDKYEFIGTVKYSFIALDPLLKTSLDKIK